MEEHLKNLIKVYKQMGGKGVRESVNENISIQKNLKSTIHLKRVISSVSNMTQVSVKVLSFIHF